MLDCIILHVASTNRRCERVTVSAPQPPEALEQGRFECSEYGSIPQRYPLRPAEKPAFFFVGFTGIFDVRGKASASNIS